MKRARRARVKVEAGAVADPEEHDLAYYIHDRVELMHQVFSVLRSKEMRAMTPEAVRNLSTDDLQELCLEELLGISSKRLCAVLDGAEAPSDTSSSDSDNERLDTISLDSISSPDDLSITSNDKKKEKRKCKRKQAKKKVDASKSSAAVKVQAAAGGDKADGEPSSRAAERAGMTVLELLELQARARAIRAQLTLEQATRPTEASAQPLAELVPGEESDGSIEIKEEPQEIVELISSDEEQVKQEHTEPDPVKQTAAAETVSLQTSPHQSTVTKKNDLTIIIPNKQAHRKIKLNRNKVIVSVTNALEVPSEELRTAEIVVNTEETIEKGIGGVDEVDRKTDDKSNKSDKTKGNKNNDGEKKTEAKPKKKKVKRIVNRKESRDGSDHDEITIQLSDSEKMDLLEDFNRTRYDNVSSSDDESSDERESGDENVDLVEKTKPPLISINDSKGQSEEASSKIVSQSEKESTSLSTNVDNGSKVDVNIEIHEEKKIDGQVQSRKDEKTKTENIQNYTETRNHILNKKEGSDIVAMETEINTSEVTIVEEIHLPNIEHNTESNIVITSIEDIPLVAEYFGPKNFEIEQVIDKHERIVGEKEKETETIELVNGSEKKSLKNADASHILTEMDVRDKPISEDASKTSHSNQTNNPIAINKLTITNVDDNKTSDTGGTMNEKEVPSETPQRRPKSDTDRNMSDGELTDRSSSEVEMFDKPSEIVCISDDDEVPKSKKKKTKTKKDKKSKKEKKDKKDKKSDFRQAADHNFYNQTDSSDDDNELTKPSRTTLRNEDSNKSLKLDSNTIIVDEKILIIPDTEFIDLESSKVVNGNSTSLILSLSHVDSHQYIDSSDKCVENKFGNVDQILEISDDSSCCEVEGVNVLSKEPTSEEIEALSAKIDNEIEREEVVTEEQIRHHEGQISEHSDMPEANVESGNDLENLEDISWKDRWLDSHKVKKVLVTSNILNAVRKKNKELKKKLMESRKKLEVQQLPKVPEVPKEAPIEEGSIEQFNLLPGLTQFVDPVKEPIPPEELIAAVNVAVQTANGQVDRTPSEKTEPTENHDTNPVAEAESKGLPIKTSCDAAKPSSITISAETHQTEAGIQNVAAAKAMLDKDLKKDAKQLLKMYKRLLKFNKTGKQSDLNKTKKKKSKKDKSNVSEKDAAADVQ